MRILSIDPSGTGTSGIFFSNDKEQSFQQFQSKDWTEHYAFISEIVKEKQPNLLIYESTNYIRIKGNDMTSLFKLFGALECLPIKEIKSISVVKVKEFYKKLLSRQEKITDLEFKNGRGQGWIYQGQRISKHCLDALLIYLIWKEKVWRK